MSKSLRIKIIEGKHVNPALFLKYFNIGDTVKKRFKNDMFVNLEGFFPCMTLLTSCSKCVVHNYDFYRKY